MVSFKDKIDKINGRKIDFKETKEAGINKINNLSNKLNNNLSNGDVCKPGGNVVDYRSRFPGGVIPPGVIPPGGEPGRGGSGGGVGISTGSIEDKLDVIIELLSKYKTGGKFSSKVLKTQAATPIEIAFDNTQPSPNPMIIGFYDVLDVHNAKSPAGNADVLWVIADGPVSPTDPFIYVRSSSDRQSFTQEVPVRLGEKWGFEDVYELRVRSALAGTQYRASEYDNQLTYVSVVVNTPLNVAANRSDFIDLNIVVNMTDSVLPSLIVPDGFSLTIRSSPLNAFGSLLFTSRTDATFSGNRNTLLPGDVKEYFITNADLVHVAASQDGLILDISVEQ